MSFELFAALRKSVTNFLFPKWSETNGIVEALTKKRLSGKVSVCECVCVCVCVLEREREPQELGYPTRQMKCLFITLY